MTETMPRKKRQIDICERCKFSAYVDEGDSWFDKVDEDYYPEWHFVCAKCLAN